MKNPTFPIQFRKLLYLFGILFILTYLVSISFAKNLSVTERFFLPILPDTIPTDTSAEIFTSGDTINILADGQDTIFVLYTDTTFAEGDTIPDSTELRTFDVTKDITVSLQGYTQQVNQGLSLIHISEPTRPY